MPRADLIQRWLALTRDVLPAMAEGHRWPIRRDHCFMRVCLDAAVGQPWAQVVARPAIRNLSDDQLAAAVRPAEAIVAQPYILAGLNAQSLAWRASARGR